MERNQLDQCAQLTKKRVKSGITVAFRGETPRVWGAIEIKDRAEIPAETSDVFDRRRRGREMILLDSARAWRIYDDFTKAERSALIVLFTCVSECV